MPGKDVKTLLKEANRALNSNDIQMAEAKLNEAKNLYQNLPKTSDYTETFNTLTVRINWLKIKDPVMSESKALLEISINTLDNHDIITDIIKRTEVCLTKFPSYITDEEHAVRKQLAENLSLLKEKRQLQETQESWDKICDAITTLNNDLVQQSCNDEGIYAWFTKVKQCLDAYNNHATCLHPAQLQEKKRLEILYGERRINAHLLVVKQNLRADHLHIALPELIAAKELASTMQKYEQDFFTASIDSVAAAEREYKSNKSRNANLAAVSIVNKALENFETLRPKTLTSKDREFLIPAIEKDLADSWHKFYPHDKNTDKEQYEDNIKFFDSIAKLFIAPRLRETTLADKWMLIWTSAAFYLDRSVDILAEIYKAISQYQTTKVPYNVILPIFVHDEVVANNLGASRAQNVAA